MVCPLCRESEIGDDNGSSTYSACKVGFEIEDKGECVLIGTDDPRMQLYGQVFMDCGFVRQSSRKTCAYCNGTLNRKMH